MALHVSNCTPPPSLRVVGQNKMRRLALELTRLVLSFSALKTRGCSYATGFDGSKLDRRVPYSFTTFPTRECRLKFVKCVKDTDNGNSGGMMTGRRSIMDLPQGTAIDNVTGILLGTQCKAAWLQNLS